MEHLILKRKSKARVLEGHPWVFAGEVESLLEASWNRVPIELKTTWGASLGFGIYNAYSQIVWRRLSRGPIKNIEVHLEESIVKAIHQRPPELCRRLISSEADFLPGLIVDQFEDVLVVQ